MKFHPESRAFTTQSTGIVRELRNQIHVSEAYDPATDQAEPVKRPYNAIWDTGATGTLIVPKIAQELNLQPSGRETVHAVGAGGQINAYEANTYLVNVYLPNQVCIAGVRVAEGTIGGAEVLLGMDIIGFGDFAIANHNAQTSWTFRTPSHGAIDFVKEINEYRKKYGISQPPVDPEKRRMLRNIRKRLKRKTRGK